MNRFFKTMLLVSAMTLCLPTAGAQSRRPGGSHSRENTARTTAPSSSRGANKSSQGIHRSGSHSRPGAIHGKDTRNDGRRKDGSSSLGQVNTSRPSHNNTPSHRRPNVEINHTGTGTHRPGTSRLRPGVTIRRPSPKSHCPSYRMSHRPYHHTRRHLPRPAYYHWYRPVVPLNWHPHYHRCMVPSLLGLTYGIALNNALEHLYSLSYAVSNHTPSEIYLQNVSQYGYNWPDATLCFDNQGGLDHSLFYDCTISRNESRYRNIYSQLVANYGQPAINESNEGVLTATWISAQGDYISLQYGPQQTDEGDYRYFTILSIGR